MSELHEDIVSMHNIRSGDHVLVTIKSRVRPDGIRDVRSLLVGSFPGVNFTFITDDAPIDVYVTPPYEMDKLSLAEILFNSYGDHCQWRAYNGEPMRTWEQLNDASSPVVLHWVAVAQRAKDLLIGEQQ